MNTNRATTKIENSSRSALVARRFRGMLAELQISGLQASKMLGWSQSAIQRRLDGRTELSINDLDEIEKKLGIPMLYLLGKSEDRPAAVRRPDADVVFMSPRDKESFLSESNRRPFHYKAEGPNILPFRTRPGLPDVESGAGVQDTQISETPGTVFEFPTVANDGMELGVTADIIHMPGTWTA